MSFPRSAPIRTVKNPTFKTHSQQNSPLYTPISTPTSQHTIPSNSLVTNINLTLETPTGEIINLSLSPATSQSKSLNNNTGSAIHSYEDDKTRKNILAQVGKLVSSEIPTETNSNNQSSHHSSHLDENSENFVISFNEIANAIKKNETTTESNQTDFNNPSHISINVETDDDKEPLIGFRENVIFSAVKGAFNSKDQTTWPEWAKRNINNLFVNPVIKGFNYVKQHPIAVFLAILFALPDGINSFCGWAGIDPKDLLTALSTMSIDSLLMAALNAFSAIAINSTMNALFFPTAMEELKKGFAKCSDVSGTLGNSASIIIGLSAFAAAFGISYAAFAWLPASTITAIIPALFKAIATFTSRYVKGLSTIVSKVKGLFDEDGKLQKNALDKLKHIKAEFLEDINKFLRNRELNDETITSLFEAIDAQPNVLNKTGIFETIKHGLGTIFDVLFTLTIAANVYPTFGQKGFDGIKELVGLFTNLFEKENPLASFNSSSKTLVGTLPAIASTIFYGIGASELSDKLSRLWERVLQNPMELVHILPLIGANALSGSGMYSVASNCENIFNLPYNPIMNGAGAAAVNLNVTAGLYLRNPALEPGVSPTVKDTVNYLTENRLPHDSVEKLRKLGLFKPKQTFLEAEPTKVHQVDIGLAM